MSLKVPRRSGSWPRCKTRHWSVYIVLGVMMHVNQNAIAQLLVGLQSVYSNFNLPKPTTRGWTLLHGDNMPVWYVLKYLGDWII